MLVEGRTAVITGGAQGLGLEKARGLMKHGAKVVLADVDGELAVKAAAELGEGAYGIGCNVTDAASVQAAIDFAVEKTGRLDIMVNNAGVSRDATMKNMTEEMFDLVIDVHVKGTWLGTKLASLKMAELGNGGSIINVSSISGKAGMFGQTNYSAAKAGIIGLSKAAAKECARNNVRVNVVQPGLIRSVMTESMPQAAWDQKMSEIPLRRAGEPSEVADVVVFLASDMSSYITGNVIEIAGGRLM